MTLDLLAVLSPVVPVIEEPGWRNRGHNMPFSPRAVLQHHDASAVGPSPGVVALLIGGRPGISGPLAQLWSCLGCGGRHPMSVHLIAAGHCNHGGLGGGWGVIPKDAANRYSYGHECDHTTGEPLDPALYAMMVTADRALLAAMGADPRNALAGHKEYAPGRKTDPDWDMGRMRADVLGGTSSPLPAGTAGSPVPITNTASGGIDVSSIPTIRQGSTGQIAKNLQALLTAAARPLTIDGDFGPKSAAALREWQGAAGLVADGVAGPVTWRTILGATG